MFDNKSVSVVIPAHNEGKLILRVLTTLPKWMDRIFVVDDFSADRTAEIVREYQQKDTRVELYQHKENRASIPFVCHLV